MRDLGKNALEWAVFAVSCVLVLVLLGFLGWTAFAGDDSRARIELSLAQPALVGKSWQVEVEVENRGGQSAEGVEIEVEWPQAKQTARFVLPFLPRLGARSGTAVFALSGNKKPAVQDLEARVTGFELG